MKVFFAHDVECGVGFAAAKTRLSGLVAGHVLVDASRAAYHEGLAGLGLAEPRLARVCSFTCGRGGGQVTTVLRWEASGVSAGLFPVLDADLTLSPTGWSNSRLALVGVYRPPFGDLGRRDLDPALSDRVADRTVRALLYAVAGYLTGARAIFPPVRIPRQAHTS